MRDNSGLIGKGKGVPVRQTALEPAPKPILSAL
jgi:hypothetical protein